jgi:prolyl-tRNA synthetase
LGVAHNEKEKIVTKKEKTAITPTRVENYPEWYQQVIRAAELAEPSVVRGCMVIRPWGYTLWENMQAGLDGLFKATGHVNAYFPLFIPLSYLEKEAEHVEGFAKECAVVTHHRLEAKEGGGLVPAGKLEEPLVVRPTSETIIGASFAKWVQSYRDLPILLNQWCNVVRWEMRTRLFLRTSEFLWQEGHTVHETSEEAWEETLRMLEVYRTFVEEYLAIPVIAGEKSAGERFPGAVNTFSIEAMMQDRKALQSGTSHFLGQNFAKATNIVFQAREGGIAHAWTTSWGFSTRMIGGIIMVHGDDNGVIMPPRVSPRHVVILPIIKSAAEEEGILNYCRGLADKLGTKLYHNRKLEVMVDTRDLNAGEKGWDWVKKGVPVIVEVGPRDMAQNSLYIGRRDQSRKERYSQNQDAFLDGITNLLDDIQQNLFAKAKAYRDQNLKEIERWNDFLNFFTPENKEEPEIHGGFALSHWCGNPACESRIKEELSVTIRCIPLNLEKNKGSCIVCGNPSTGRVVFGKAY